mmetsp:Transcript_8688/g.11449  ORF Transcript_8688/g.11449 Transcript_8688/m.11449 type:complete len:200 (-) Transcript_8688:241-840(-)
MDSTSRNSKQNTRNHKWGKSKAADSNRRKEHHTSELSQVHLQIDDCDDELIADQESYSRKLEKARKREVEDAVRVLVDQTLEEEGYYKVQQMLGEIETLTCENRILRLKCGYNEEKYRCPKWHSEAARIKELEHELVKKQDKIIKLKLALKSTRSEAEEQEQELNEEIKKLRMRIKELNLLLENQDPKRSCCQNGCQIV